MWQEGKRRGEDEDRKSIPLTSLLGGWPIWQAVAGRTMGHCIWKNQHRPVISVIVHVGFLEIITVLDCRISGFLVDPFTTEKKWYLTYLPN